MANHSWMVIGALALVTTTAQAEKKVDKLQMTEGMWEMSGQMEINGGKQPVQAQKQCLTKKDMVPSSWMKDLPPGMKCDTDHNITASTVNWTMSCTMQGGSMKMTGKITYSGKTFRGGATIDVKMDGAGAMTGKMTMSGKYVGPCTK